MVAMVLRGVTAGGRVSLLRSMSGYYGVGCARGVGYVGYGREFNGVVHCRVGNIPFPTTVYCLRTNRRVVARNNNVS